MSIKVTCAACGKTLKARDDYAGKKTKCPGCGEPLTIPEPIYDAEQADEDVYDPDSAEDYEADEYDNEDDAYAEPDDRKPCRACGEMIKRAAAKCRYCGEIFDRSLAGSQRISGSRGKSSKDLAKEKQDKSTGLQLFLTGLLGCFSPIAFIYGIVFLVKRPYAFPNKGLAIAGTILHGLWTLFLVVALASGGGR